MLPQRDYLERTYAGVLGKIIGVYLGRPVENWTYERITAEFGEIDRFVHESRDRALIVPDDDITGTFTFPRALEENGFPRDLAAGQVGESWLNHIVEGRTCLWWGGFGNSTEHTAYSRLKAGTPAPESGSIALNGPVVAEQIGAQIFIDAWAMVAPGDPQLAASLARAAASVSHDGEAVHAAVALAVMESLAYLGADPQRLLDAAREFIPAGSVIRRLHDDLRAWHGEHPDDWRATRERLQAEYGYHRYGGNVHVVPNHGVILLALLHGNGDLSRSLTIATTCGWDTDCNVGNVGCLVALMGGLGAFTGPVADWREQVADRLYLPGGEGGRAITDALTVAREIVSLGRKLAGETPSEASDQPRYRFEMPGSVQGFVVTAGQAELANPDGEGLVVRAALKPEEPVRVTSLCFIPPEVPDPPDAPFARNSGFGWNYTLLASPSLYPGQRLKATVEALAENASPVTLRLALDHYGLGDEILHLSGKALTLAPGAGGQLDWTVPDLDGLPVQAVGMELSAAEPTSAGVRLTSLGWSGTPKVTLGRPAGSSGQFWRRAWVNAAQRIDRNAPEDYRVLNGPGTGLLTQGAPDWTDYAVQADVSLHAAQAGGIAARAQGLRRRYSLLLARGNRLRLVKSAQGQERVLAERDFAWTHGEQHRLRLEARGAQLSAIVDGQEVFTVTDEDHPLLHGGVALVIEEGWLSAGPVQVEPA